MLGTQQQKAIMNEATLYPNPAQTYITLQIEAAQNSWAVFSISDMNGKIVAPLLCDQLKAGISNFSFQTDGLPVGTYYLTITAHDQIIQTKSFVVTR
jgi:hypothetical protein